MGKLSVAGSARRNSEAGMLTTAIPTFSKTGCADHRFLQDHGGSARCRDRRSTVDGGQIHGQATAAPSQGWHTFLRNHTRMDRTAVNKMHRPLVPFSGSGTSRHARSLADFITTMSGFRFSVHTRVGAAKSVVNLDGAGLRRGRGALSHCPPKNDLASRDGRLIM
jgi:hypothetical protein